MTVHLGADSLLCIVGHRGCGKTRFAKAYLGALRPRRLIIVDPLNQYADFGLPVVLDTAGIVRQFRAGDLRFRLVSPAPDDAQALIRLAYETTDLCLTLDEGDAILGPCKWETPPAFARFCNYGRHSRLSAVVLAHRGVDLPRVLTSQSALAFAHAVDPNDRTWLQRRLGGAVPSLQRFQFCLAPLYGEHAIITAQDLEGAGP